MLQYCLLEAVCSSWPQMHVLSIQSPKNAHNESNFCWFYCNSHSHVKLRGKGGAVAPYRALFARPLFGHVRCILWFELASKPKNTSELSWKSLSKRLPSLE